MDLSGPEPCYSSETERTAYMPRLSLLLGAAFFVYGCGWIEPPPSSEAELIGTQWRLGRIVDEGGDVVYTRRSGERYHFLLHDDGTAEGRNACNACEGDYDVGDGDRLSISLSCTEMACGPDLEFPHLSYPDLLASVETYELTDGRLRMEATSRDGSRYVLYHFPFAGR